MSRIEFQQVVMEKVEVEMVMVERWGLRANRGGVNTVKTT